MPVRDNSQPEQTKVDQAIQWKLNKIPVIYYDRSREGELIDTCYRSTHVGLTHIRLDSGNDILICLTTQTRIFVLDTRHTSHIDMVRKLLTENVGIKFYTTRGHFVAFRLFTEFGITCNTSSMTDLTAYEVFLSMRKCCLNGSLTGDYKMENLIKLKDMIRYHDRWDLTKMYLGVTLPERNKQEEKHETNLIRQNIESDEAKEVIRKRACLVNELAVKMEENFQVMTFKDVNNLYSFAHRVDDERYIEYENLGDDCYTTVIDYLKR